MKLEHYITAFIISACICFIYYTLLFAIPRHFENRKKLVKTIIEYCNITNNIKEIEYENVICTNNKDDNMQELKNMKLKEEE